MRIRAVSCFTRIKMVSRKPAAWAISMWRRRRGERRSCERVRVAAITALSALMVIVGVSPTMLEAIDAGSAADAERYYAQIAAVLEFAANKPPADLDTLLEYCGYRELKAVDIA